MGVRYRLDVKTVAGVKVAEIADPLSLSFTRQVNAPGILEFTLNQADTAVALIADKYQVECWRSWPEESIDWYREFDTIFRDDIPQTTDDGLKQFLARCYGTLHILSWQENLYDSGVTNKTKFTSAKPETILKTLITNNFTTTGTTAFLRDRNATSASAVNGFTITVETDSARGVAMNLETARGNVLDDLQKIQQVNVSTATPFDFDLVKQSGSTYQFQFKTPVLGTDRSSGASAVVFSEDYDNMRHPRLERIRSIEKTAVVVGGGGQGTERVKSAVRTGTNYNVSTNAVESFYNGAPSTQGTTTAGTLNALGDKEATRLRMRPHLSYDVAQKVFLYGRDYFLGDKVLARYFGTSFTQQIYRITIAWEKGGEETIKVEMRDL